jgi:hypothetical protein
MMGLTGRAEVREDETVDNLFVADGQAVIDGRVKNGVIALNGDVLVRWMVEDNVVAPYGRVVVAESGWLEGDAVSLHRPVIQSGGRFDGDWERWNPRAWSRGTRIAIWIAFTVSTLVLGCNSACSRPVHPVPSTRRPGSASVRPSAGASC